MYLVSHICYTILITFYLLLTYLRKCCDNKVQKNEHYYCQQHDYYPEEI